MQRSNQPGYLHQVICGFHSSYSISSIYKITLHKTLRAFMHNS